jgi:protein phosphatase
MVRLEDGAREPSRLRCHQLGERGTLLAVCDGMGGAAAGEVASELAVETLTTAMLDETTPAPPRGVVDDGLAQLARTLRSAAVAAHERIVDNARDNPGRVGMGTTLTALHLCRGYAIVAQVGDSRAYILRQGRFTQITRDQSLVGELIETGQLTAEQARSFNYRNIISQALGLEADLDVKLSKVELRRGDRLLLCSDGLVGMLEDEEIASVVGAVDDPEAAVRVLVARANEAGGHDNITVIVAHVEGEPLVVPGPEDRVEFAFWHIDTIVQRMAAHISGLVEALRRTPPDPGDAWRLLEAGRANSLTLPEPVPQVVAWVRWLVLGLCALLVVWGAAFAYYNVR